MSASPSQRSSFSEANNPLTTNDDLQDDDTQQFQKIIRDRKYEHEDIQKKAFTKWINNQLENSNSSIAVNDLFQDLRDGVVLLRLLEVLTGNECKRENGKMRVHHIGNVNKVIDVLNKHGIKLLSISSNDIVDGNPKLTLALIWSIIQYWQGKDVIESVVPQTQQTNIEKFLLSWCQEQSKGYAQVDIQDFTRSWQNGLAFNALIHRFRPDLFNYDDRLQRTAHENLEHAFELAKTIFKIDRYLDVEDVLVEYPDKKSILMYVMCLFQQLPASNMVIEEKDKHQTSTLSDLSQEISTTSRESSIESNVQFASYQMSIERILQWIIKLEEQLDQENEGIESNDLKLIKERFQKHEELMIRLTKDQNQVGEILQEGNQLLTSSEIRFQADEAKQMKEQMKALNRRWEFLRSKSLERQSILHKVLMKLQIDQIESFDSWLSKTEEHINQNLEPMEITLIGVDRQYGQLAQLQDELVAQQQITESLQNMIIVLDDSNADDQQTSAAIEQKLLSLSDRWAQICNFVQNRWIQLQEVKIELEQIELNQRKLEQWFKQNEDTLEKISSSMNERPDHEQLLKQIQTIQTIETEVDNIRSLILSLDQTSKVVQSSSEFDQYDTRYRRFIVQLEICANRLKQYELEMSTDKNQETFKSEFDLSARKYFDWIDSIERILDEKSAAQVQLNERQEIIQAVKAKYFSYDEQFRNLLLTGQSLTKSIQDGNEDPTEHQSAVQTLERRWNELHQQIVRYEKDVEQSIIDYELEELNRIHQEYQKWIETLATTTPSTEIQVKFQTFQSFNERLAQLKRMASRCDPSRNQRTDEFLRSWEETESRMRERIIPVEHIRTQTTGTNSSEGFSMHHTGSTSAPTSPVRVEIHDDKSIDTSGATIGPSIGENGSLFTLTNIYTFGGDGHGSLSDHGNPSFAERFNVSGSGNANEYARYYHAEHSSSSVTRKIHTIETDAYDYDENGNCSSSRRVHHHDSMGPLSPRPASNTSYYSQLSTVFTDTQRKLRLWIEHVEKSLSSEKLHLIDTNAINKKRRFYKELLDQTLEQEHHLESLNNLSRDYTSKLTYEQNRHLQDDLLNYRQRLNGIKMFLTDALTKYQRYENSLTEFEREVEEVHQWMKITRSRLLSSETVHGDSRVLENHLSRNQALQEEIRQMQALVDQLNRDVVELTRDAEEAMGHRLRDDMYRLNESWSQIISSTKATSQTIQDALKRSKFFEEEIRLLEEWIHDRSRQLVLDDDSIFYQDQLRERYEFYRKLQIELGHKEQSVRSLVDQMRQDQTQPTHIIDNLITDWSQLQRKIDSKTQFYTDLYRVHEELKELIHGENVWLDQLQNKLYSTISTGADAEEISEELDSLETFVKSHSRHYYERILEISDRLHVQKVSLPTTTSQINQFQMRWEQLHNEVSKKIQQFHSQISDYQQLGHEITAMIEWMKHTDNTLNARLKDNICANDVPSEAEKLIGEFRQYETFLRMVEGKIQNLRVLGKNDAARRLEQQFIVIRNQFTQLENKFRQFQKPSDFEPRFHQIRRVLHEVDQNCDRLEIRSDDPEVIHGQCELSQKLFKTLADIKSEVEFVMRIGRGIIERQQTNESHELKRQIDQLKSDYNSLGDKVSSSKRILDSVERHSRKFRKEYSQIHEWWVRADEEIRKIENKQVSKNTKEEADWIRTTRSDIRKLDTGFETLRSLERSIQKEVGRTLPGLHEKIAELKRQIDQLDRRLRDRSEIVEGQIRKLDDEYRRFGRIYEEIIIRLDRLESLLSDAERALDITRVTQVQDEIRNVRIQLDELLNLGQELVSKSDRYSRLVGPDVEHITQKFEELQRRIRVIQETQEKHMKEQQTRTSNITENDQQDDVRREYFSERRYHRTQRETRHRSPSESSEFSTTHGVIDEEFKKKYLRCLAYMKLIERLYENQGDSDEEHDLTQRRLSRRDRSVRHQPEYEEIERIIRETEERACIIERTDVEQAHRIREKIRRLRDYLEILKMRSEQWQANDEIVQINERFSRRVTTTDRTVPREREFDSDFIYDADDTRSVISEPAPFHNTRYRKTVHSLERHRFDERSHLAPAQEEYQLQPLLRVRSLKAIDHRALSAPSSPVLQPRYRSYERSNIQYTKQSNTQQGYKDQCQSSISKSASMPNGGFPVHQNLLPQPPPAPYIFPNQPMTYRERVIDRHVAERSTSRNESHRQHQESASQSQHQHQHQQQQQQKHVRSASASTQNQLAQRSIPVQYEASNQTQKNFGFQTMHDHNQESSPNYFFHEQYPAGNTAHGFRQAHYDQQVCPPQTVGGHPTRTYH